MSDVRDPDDSRTQTTELLDRAREGEIGAADRLFGRLIPRLARWASRRLPRDARGHLDTADIVQDTLLRSLAPLRRFQARGKGSLDAYLRQIAKNRILDQIRYAGRRPARVEFEDLPVADSPLDAAITADDQARYARCLARLSATDQAAVTGRMGEGLSYEQLAERLNKPTAGAARVAVTRALMRLAREMDRESTR